MKSRGLLWRPTLLALVLGLLLALAPAPASAARATIRYTALGDSIARGMGATAFYGYVDHFRDHLMTRHRAVVLVNAAIPGMTSGDLLLQLRTDPVTRAAVRHAQVLTISIGGNNLLPCAADNYETVDPACGAAGVAAFQRDWPQILAEIRGGIGSRAALYAMTLYNPYPGDHPNYAVADSYVEQLNDTIRDAGYTAGYRYAYAEVHGAFQGQAGGTWRVCLWTHFCEAARDPHPIDSGHREIAALHAALSR